MRYLPAVLIAVLVASPAAQVQSRPTDPPIVTAQNESWYRLGEPLQFAGDVYYPAGAAVFFNGNTMVRSGHYNGVPLYADTTIEPYSIVYVPIGRGLLQPYERIRQGELAGSTGSRTPAFPVRAVPGAQRPPVAPSPPTAPPLPIGAVSAFTPEAGAVGSISPAREGTAAAVADVPGPTLRQVGMPFISVRRPDSNDGVWVPFKGEKWVSAGPAVPLRASEFVHVGDYAGFPVFARQGLQEEMIYLPMPEGLVAPYRLK